MKENHSLKEDKDHFVERRKNQYVAGEKGMKVRENQNVKYEMKGEIRGTDSCFGNIVNFVDGGENAMIV